MSKSCTINYQTVKESERDLKIGKELQRRKIELYGLNCGAEREDNTPLLRRERRMNCSKMIGTQVGQKTEPMEYI